MSSMKVILGTMTFADQVEESTAREMLETFQSAGHVELDTAHVYNDGKTENLLGELLPNGGDFTTATKVHPWNDQGLKPEQVHHQFSESLQRLGTDQVDLLYLHSPDLDTPIADTLAACWEIHQQGKFRRFGLSNYASWQVAEIVELCRHHGWMVPTVYQGMYNALTRDVERELFPCLRNYGMVFYAYNPLAGGMLSGKYAAYEKPPEGGRFATYDAYPERYWKTDYFNVVKRFADVCAEHGIAPVDAAIRWLQHHSLMSANAGDGIIIGVSKQAHLEQNLKSFDQGELPEKILEVLDQGWEVTRPNCFRYFRP